MTRVDVHAHTFNADDLPVEGFVSRVVGGNNALRQVVMRAVGRALDRATQARAEGGGELARLDRLIAEGAEGGLEHGEAPTMVDVEMEADALLAELTATEPTLVAAASAEASRGHDEAGDAALADMQEEGLVDSLAAVKRYVQWALLFGRSRWELTVALMRLYRRIDLFVSLLVDFQELGDAPETSMDEQMQMQERISRLSLLGRTDAVVLPFIGYDPRRAGALGLVQRAVRDHGAVGVKLYPPMGFCPLKNVDHVGAQITRDEASAMDHELAQLYEWCCEWDVPITAHCNPSNFAHVAYRSFSHPRNWEHALTEYPDLRVNLGHFGWGAASAADDWPRQIAELMSTYRHLYADIGNHELGDLDQTLGRVHSLFDDASTATAAKRFMFGSDWFMVASHRGFEHFADEVEQKFRAKFPEHADDFMGGIALEFLGFTDADNKNRRRVLDRIAEHGAKRPDWLPV